MSSEVRVEVEGDASGMVVGVSSSNWTATEEVFPTVLGSFEEKAVVSELVNENVVVENTVPVKRMNGQKKITDRASSKGRKKIVNETSSRHPVEKKSAGSGLLQGYLLKADSEEKDKASYDFVNYTWVDPTIWKPLQCTEARRKQWILPRRMISLGITFMEQLSVASVLMMIGFVLDLQRTTFNLLSIHPGRKLLKALTISYMNLKDHFFRLRSKEGTMAFYKDKEGSTLFPLYWSPHPNVVLGVDPSYFSDSDLAEVRFLEVRVPLKCLKLIKFEEEPEKLKRYIDCGRLDQSKVSRKEDQILDQSVGSSKKRKRSKDVGSSEVHNISDDEQRSENIVDVFQEFLGSTPEVRTLWDSRFEFGNLIDAECSLLGDQSHLEKWDPRSTHVMLQIQGIRSASIGRYFELQHMRGISDPDDLRKKIIDLEKDLTLYEELHTKVAGLEGRVALLNQEKEDLVQNNKTLPDQLNQEKDERKLVDAVLLQEKVDHDATKIKSTFDRDQLTILRLLILMILGLIKPWHK
ncbi:hypothetical protein SESBI_42581 [Sesbania bispinosa]|nr:hypothetical protein SESBI_42581 [Sesbania bispinosa]